MRLIGYWIESLRDTDYPAPQEFVGDWSPDVRARVADHLDRGQVWAEYRGISWCRFLCNYPSMGSRELTDGYWVWPEGLSHYVRDHAVTLPPEFVRHIESRPVPIPEEQWDMSVPDEEFWKAWSRRNTSREWRARLAAARQGADREAERVFADAVAEREALRTGETMTVGFWVARPRAAAKPTAMGVGRCGRFRHAHRSVRCAHFALGRAPPILDSYSFAGP
jgi:hypothetical protein